MDTIKLAIMQPYIFPYIGYFQLMKAVDTFVVYDNVEYTKKGWINRNRILVNGSDALISLPLKKGSDFLDIRERQLSDSWPTEREKILNRIRENYRQADFFPQAFTVVSEAMMHETRNLFEFLFNALIVVRNYLKIDTPLVVSSSISIDHSLKSQARVIELCRAMHATEYINPIGGVDLYDRKVFQDAGIVLKFLRSGPFEYNQFGHPFQSNLSIIDVMMFNSIDAIGLALANNFELV